MRPIQPALIVFTVIASSLAFAQQQGSIASESRDASLAYIGTTNFIVGRVGSECLATLGRSESPQQFVAAWQQRNAKYVTAAGMYMEKRLDEAQMTGGPEKRTAVLREVTSVSRRDGEAVVRSWFEKDGKVEACKRAVGLIEAGGFDVSPRIPMFNELESLASWAQK